MELRWDRLRVLVEVAQEESIGGAADVLHLTGPAVSQQVRRLEREVGRSLVEPHGRGIRLTAAGQVLARHAAQMARTVRTAQQELAATEGEVAGPVRIGSVNASMREVVPQAMRRLAAEHPALEITAIDGEASLFLPQLRAGDLDLVIGESWAQRRLSVPPGVEVLPLLTEQLDLAVLADDPLAHQAAVDLGSLPPRPWIGCQPGAEAHDGLVQVLRERGVEPWLAVQASDFATHLEFVEEGLGYALVPWLAQPWAPTSVRFVPCRPLVRRDLVVLVKQGPRAPAVQACLDGLVSTVRERVAEHQG